MTIVQCKKCGRNVDVNGWLLRAGRCSPKDWGRCIREPEFPIENPYKGVAK